jgi:ATP-dependent protease HslVU (ClpYQ) peptidase subunit
MTAIVAVRDERRNLIYLGADSLASNGFQSSRVSDPKIFQKGEFLIAYAGSFRSGQVLAYRFQPPPLPKTDKRLFPYMVNEFTEALRESLGKAGRIRKDMEQESAGMLEFLVAVRGHIYAFQEDFSVLEPGDGYAAAGSGESYCVGSLHSTKSLKIHPERRVRLALEAASHHDPNVGPPFVIKKYKIK